ncbi:MAG: threonylcarbamoyl-AMP synthase [Pseudomonadales bacterium]|jgi:L-threonylcarbamoyladenylate synthase|nr:threonylcarbamoyl-AMP synthase [Pseudomonadales bacterium]
MNTLLLDAANAAGCRQALALLRAGELVAVPTETVYGLAADARQAAAVAKIFAAKERPVSHPLIVHIAGSDALAAWADPVPEAARRLGAAFWPGPLTLLLHKAPQVNSTVTGGRDSIGLRVPDHPVLLALLRELGSGLAAPSANLHKQLSPTSAPQVLASLGGRIAAVLDGGSCRVGLESTIVDLTQEAPRILRSGPITRTQLEAALGAPILLPATHEVAVSGNMQVHYQPRAPLYVMTRTALAQYLTTHTTERLALLYYGAAPKELAQVKVLACLDMPTDKAGYARALYRNLYELDVLQPEAILLEQPPYTEEWLDVQDRLRKAATRLEGAL